MRIVKGLKLAEQGTVMVMAVAVSRRKKGRVVVLLVLKME
jgi:hypothetical protein